MEFVVLDYDSADGLKEWLFGSFSEQIRQGTIRYSHFGPAPYFRMAHAKNLAHLAATGEILCSLDADNLLERGLSDWIISKYLEDSNFIASPRLKYLTGYVWQRWIEKRFGMRAYESGLGGRIALSRASFLMLGGYDEHMSAWGGDDLDFMLKARDNGLKWTTIPKKYWGEAIEHTHESRLENLSDGDASYSNKRLERSVVQQFLDARKEYRRTDRLAVAIGR